MKKVIAQEDKIDTIKQLIESSQFCRAGRERKKYKESLYYARIFMAIVVCVSLITTVSCVSYLTMGNETYFTTDYSGQVRQLHPLLDKSR